MRGNHSSKILCFLFLYIHCIFVTVLYADTTTTQAATCNFYWNITKVDKETLTVIWSGDGDGNVTVTLKETCSNGSCSQSNVTANFSEKRVKLKPWSNNTKYEVEITFNCTYSSGKRIKSIWTPPAPPSEIESTDCTDTKITLRWKSPPGRGAIEMYRLEVNKSQTFLETPNTTAEITGLKPYTVYQVQVAARNQDFWGDMSDKIKLRTKAGIPHKPKNLRPTVVTEHSLMFEWEEPVPSTGEIKHYLTSFSVQNVSETKTTVKRSMFFDGLSPFTLYYMGVAAVTSAGVGDYIYVWQKTYKGVPAPPELKIGRILNTSITLSWSHSKFFVIPYPSYYLGWRVAGESYKKSTFKEIDNNTKQYTIWGLIPFTTYVVQIRSYIDPNYRGWPFSGYSLWSDEQYIKTENRDPVIIIQGIHLLEGRSVEVIWATRGDYPGPHNYTLKARNLPGPFSDCFNKYERNSTMRTISLEDWTRNHSDAVTDLIPFQKYSIEILLFTTDRGIATNKSKTIQIPPEAAGEPTLVTANCSFSPTEANVNWSPPKKPNGIIYSYIVEYCLEKGHHWHFSVEIPVANMCDDQSLLLKGLIPGQPYDIRVYARVKDVQGNGRAALPEGECILPTGVPDPPNMTVEEIQNTSLTVSWNISDDYRGPAPTFSVRWKATGGGWYTIERFEGSFAGNWYNITGLTPHTVYEVQVRGSTRFGDGRWSEALEVLTNIGVPSVPLNFTLESYPEHTVVKLIWNHPLHPNAPNIKYKVMWNTSREEIKSNYTENMLSDKRIVNYVISNLIPYTNYSACVCAITDVGQGPWTAFISFRTAAGIPYLSKISRVTALVDISEPKYLVLEWGEDLFSDYMGRLVRYAVLVGRQDSLGNATSGLIVESAPTWLSYKVGHTDFYQATPMWWNPFNGGPDSLECVKFLEWDDNSNKTVLTCYVGIQTSCLHNETYCNGPLEPGVQYEIKIRGFTEGGYNETDPILARTHIPHQDIPLGTIITAVVLFLVVLLAGGFGISRKFYLNKSKEAIKLTRRYSESSLAVFEQEMGQNPLSRSIKCKLFDYHIRIMMSDSHLKFAQEFEMLENESPHFPCTFAEMDINNSKNRRKGVLPFDHSRVKLLPLCDEPGSDFINANYIPGFSSRREYIGSQGPLPNTVEDFWRMIWEQSVSVLVMLTQCLERDVKAYKKKCEQYWPDSGESNLYGDLRVTCISESVLSSYVIREFHVQMDPYERQVKQMHFTNWPDFGCPESPKVLINFVKSVRDILPREDPGPILVHCSAGVGRTGTYIAVDRLSQQLQVASTFPEDDTVNIYATVLELRNHRSNIVQTEDQYIYVHLCVSQLIRDRDESRLQVCEEVAISDIAV